jgi:YVTN family beta-propeller protein
VGGGWTHASGVFYTITLGTLPAHGGGELTFVVRVNDPFPPDVDRVINRVDIGGTDAECNLDNNWSADDTPVRQSVIEMGIWATGRDSNNIVLLDPRTMQVISNVTVGGMPFGIAGDEQHIYVVNFGSDNLSVLNETGVVNANIPVGVRPTFVEAMDGCAYVTNYAWPGWGTGGGITRYCPQTGATQQILSNIPGFFGIAQDAIHHHIFAANRGFFPGDPNAGIYMIDGNTLQVTKIITTSEQPYEIAYSLHSNRLYVIIPALNEVWVYDSDGGNFSAWPDYRLPTDVRRVSCQLTDELVVNGGEGIAIRGDTIYVSNYCGASITVIRDSYTVPVSNTMQSSSVSPRDVTPLPYQVYLPLVMGGNVEPAEPSVIYTIDLQPEAQQQAVPYAAQAACTGHCPKGIAFYGDKIYVSLFRTDSLAVISPTLGYMPPYTHTVMPVTPTGSIMSINQLLGRE